MPIKEISDKLDHFKQPQQAQSKRSNKYVSHYLENSIGFASDYRAKSQQRFGMALWLVLRYAFDYEECKADVNFAEISGTLIFTTDNAAKPATIAHYVEKLCDYLPKVVRFCDRVEPAKTYEASGVSVFEDANLSSKENYVLDYCRNFLTSIQFVSMSEENIDWDRCEKKLSAYSPVPLPVPAPVRLPVPVPVPALVPSPIPFPCIKRRSPTSLRISLGPVVFRKSPPASGARSSQPKPSESGADAPKVTVGFQTG